VILLIIGIALSYSSVSLTIMKQPLDIRIPATLERAEWLYQGDKLVVDLSHTEPTNYMAYGVYVPKSIAIYDTRPREYNNIVYWGMGYGVEIRSNGDITITATNTPFIPDKGIDQPTSIKGLVIIWKGSLKDVKTIIFDFKNHYIIIGNTTKIQIPRDFTPGKLSVSGIANPPPYRGYIHLYGGYILKEIKEESQTARHTSPGNPPVTTTTIQSTTTTPIPPPINPPITHNNTVIIAQPIEEQVKTNTYGTIAIAMGIALILIALI